MTFLDDEVRDMFHKVSTTMQVIVAIFEHDCAKRMAQVELIGAEEDTAMCAVKDLNFSDMFTIANELNKQFPRKDKRWTVEVYDTKLKLFKFFVTKPEDFEHLL